MVMPVTLPSAAPGFREPSLDWEATHGHDDRKAAGRTASGRGRRSDVRDDHSHSLLNQFSRQRFSALLVATGDAALYEKILPDPPSALAQGRLQGIGDVRHRPG